MTKKINLITTDDDQHDALATRKLVQDSRMLPAGNEVETPHPIERAQPSPRSRPSFLLSRRMKFIYIFAILLVLLALLVNGIVLTLGHHQDVPPITSPTLTLTPGKAHPGQIVLLHVSHFAPQATIVITRDIYKAVRLDTASARIHTRPTGDWKLLLSGFVDGNDQHRE